MNEEGVERRFTKGAIPSRVMRVVICLMRLTWEAAGSGALRNGNAGKVQLAPFLLSSIFFPFQVLVATKEAPKRLDSHYGGRKGTFSTNYKLHSYKGKSNRVMAPPPRRRHLPHFANFERSQRRMGGEVVERRDGGGRGLTSRV